MSDRKALARAIAARSKPRFIEIRPEPAATPLAKTIIEVSRERRSGVAETGVVPAHSADNNAPKRNGPRRLVLRPLPRAWTVHGVVRDGCRSFKSVAEQLLLRKKEARQSREEKPGFSLRRQSRRYRAVVTLLPLRFEG